VILILSDIFFGMILAFLAGQRQPFGEPPLYPCSDPPGPWPARVFRLCALACAAVLWCDLAFRLAQHRPLLP
jgi:hypothetical protein